MSVQFKNEHRKPSKKNEKQMINHAHTNQGKRFFDSKLSTAWFSVAEGAEVDAHD